MKQTIFLLLFILFYLVGFSQTKGEFSDGLAWTKKNGKYGFINKNNKLVIPIIYDSVFTFREGVTPVKKKGKWFYINKQGIAFQKDNFENKIRKFDIARPYYNGLAVIANSYIGITDVKIFEYQAILHDGNSAFTDFIMDSVSDFDNGYAVIKEFGKYGIINLCNDYLVESKFENVDSFSNGFVKVYENRIWRKLNPYGDCISNCEGFVSNGKEDEKDIYTLTFPNMGNWLNEITKNKLDSLSKIISKDTNRKYLISGIGNYSDASQQTSWSNANKVIKYFVETKKINNNRFIFQYGEDGKYRTVKIRVAKEGEDGPNIMPPPSFNFCNDDTLIK